ncbi:hypothetical protein ACFPOU_20630 [Massilia jejuensis]|uniref:Phosphate ABC transporter substrate-binding protein n=1 Tax=Massilia jejuensis TaxID=648894 RepID=A0ABW0PLL9_9BURK
MRQLLLISGACLLTYMSPTALAADLFVIVHPGVTIAAEDIRDVFIGDKQIAGNVKLILMDNASAQKDFLERVVKISPVKYANVWTKKGFREGMNAPELKNNDAEVISAVKSTPGAIGYVSSIPPGLRVVKKY